MNKKTKVILFSAIALLILGMAFYPKIKTWFVKSEDSIEFRPSNTQKSTLNVILKVLKTGELVDLIPITGNLIPDEEVELSFESSGKITQIYFQEGKAVKKGELLAKINDAPLQAELEKLLTQVPLAQERVYRQGALLEKDAVSQEAYEQVRTELDKLNADIDLVKSRIAQTELRAPFDGVIGLRQVSEGAYASPTTVIASLTKTNFLKVEFSINESNINSVSPGTEIEFTINGDLNTYTASVYAVEPAVELSTRTMKVRARYPNSTGKIKPGLTAYIKIKSNIKKDALTIPNEAVIKEMGRDIVYLYSNGHAKLVEVVRGMRTASDLEIIEGLQSGDTLITTGVMQLRDGLPVNINSIIE
ncbi:efflux RND transporter periplasmic adaptor subunit [Bacteroidales bacterium OttesenSCG-928-M11]|nr:efflux RND transporter periplasmic adaptor subunit [Bacteroidales bacterium OttesenSCG-928-M11]